jgi:hypothetical protein
MATGNFVLDKGYRAAGALTKFRAVKFTGPEQVGPVTGIADQIAGFAQFSITAAELAKGKGASVRVAGHTEAEASAAIALGAQCGIAADGRVKTAAAGERVVGRCVGHPAAVAGDRVTLHVNVHGALA